MIPIITTTNLSKTYRLDETSVPVLEDVNVKIIPGEMVAITGPSGCGKSTVMHLLGLLDTPSTGQIFFNGQDVGHYSEGQRADFRGDKVGFVFQSFNLLKKLTSLENVLLPLIYSHCGRGSERRGRELLAEVGLSHRLNHQTSKLSGGEQQRVAIARALINDPAVILADEPTGNLDSKSGAEIMLLLKELNHRGKTLVVVTHDPTIAEACSRMIRMKDGRIIGGEISNV